ncbi:MAG: J domain-containing protein, partial [Firmicutes bacterium]|nr:J domain-containing protein [Bacillota bacterium]
MPSDMNPWRTLNIAPTRNMDIVRQAYLAAVRRHHPDLYSQDPAQAHAQEEAMKRVNLAYQQILSGKAPWPKSTAAPSAPKTAPPPPHQTRTARPGPQSRTRPTPPPQTCRVHRKIATRRCAVCHEPICSDCIGFSAN